MIPNTLLRQNARKALKPVLPVALLCALIASLPSLISQTAGILTGGSLQVYLLNSIQTQEQLFALASDPNQLLALLQAYPESGQRLLALGLSVLSFLVSPFLNVGLYHTLLRVLRGETISAGTVLERAGCFFKALGLSLLTALKTVLWALPGLAVIALSTVLLMFTQQLQLFTFLYTLGLILTMVLMIRAMLHYYLANIVLADDPDRGVMGSLRESIAIMRQRKMLFINLQLPMYFLLILATMLLEGMLTALLGAVLSSTVMMVIQLVVSVYMSANSCAFYQTYRTQQA